MNIFYGYFRPAKQRMKIFETTEAVRRHAEALRNKQMSIGFVPTMGALHEGHLSLARRASAENGAVGVSIFVNPIQFNNPADLEKYPRNIPADLELLHNILDEDDFVFTPSEKEMYPEAETHIYDFGSLAAVMEGRFRPGHFNGVGVVVNRLLRITEPDRAYFGEKDFQQLAIIRRLTEIENLPVKIIPCPIIREADGLAMSSRNQRLTPEHRRIAPVIYRTLCCANGLKPGRTPAELRVWITETINSTGLLEVEYVDFADEVGLAPANSWSDYRKIRCFIAVQAGQVRLIDNMEV
jgi:pantoate--beta-alanine ligase